MASPGPLQAASQVLLVGSEPHGEPLEEPLEELRKFVNARLSAAVEDILLAVKRTVTRYQQECPRQSMQHVGVELKEEPPGTSGGVADQPLEREQKQIIEAMATVKEEQILVNISHTFVKEEPKTFPLNAQFPQGVFKEQTQEVQTFSLRGQNPEEKWHVQLPLKTQPDQNHDMGLNQGLNQDDTQHQGVKQDETQHQDLNQDWTQDWEESAEWEYEGLPHGGRSPGQTKHLCQEEQSLKQGTLRPNLSIVAMVNLGPKLQLNGMVQNHVELNHVTLNEPALNPVQRDSGDNVTENSSDFSDSETESAKPVTVEQSLNAGTRCDDVIKTPTAEEGVARVEKRHKCKSSKVARKEGGAEAAHASSTCKRTFDLLQKVKTPCDTPPCPICGKCLKYKTSLSRHMKAHQSHNIKEEERGRDQTRGRGEEIKKADEKRRKWERIQRRKKMKERKREVTRRGEEEKEKERVRVQESDKKRKGEMREEEREEKGAREVEERKKGGETVNKREREEEMSRKRQRMETDTETDTDQTKDSSDEN